MKKTGVGIFGLVLVGSICAGHVAHAQMDLFPAFTLENAQVLPVGVRNPRYVNFFMDVTNKFDNSGVAQPLGAPLNKPVTAEAAAKSQPTVSLQRQALGLMASEGIAPGDAIGYTTGQVTTLADIKVPALAVGVTERWTMAVAVPILTVQYNVATGFVPDPKGNSFLEAVNNAQTPPDAEETYNRTATRTVDPVNTKLAELGYDPVRSGTVSSVGDIQLVSKYLLHKDDSNSICLKNQVVMPTGIGPNANRAVDVPTGSARWAMGAGLIYDRQLPADFRWNVFGNALALMPNRMEKRIPTSATDSLSGDKETLNRRLGAQFQLGTAVDQRFPSIGVVVGAGYNAQYLTQQTYEPGTSVDPIRYTYLDALKPEEVLHTVSLTAGFSTVEWYRAKKFFYPFQANLTYTRPVFGRNVNSTDLIGGELVLFF